MPKEVKGITRFIPARAGNGPSPPAPQTAWPVHPRACGERSDEGYVLPPMTGSSPRVRGTAKPYKNILQAFRFIPARAGNGSSGDTTNPTVAVHPRACGERSPTRRTR